MSRCDHGNTKHATHPRSPFPLSLGWTASRCRPKAGGEAARSASASSAAGRAPSVSRHAARSTRYPIAPDRPPREGSGGELPSSLRAKAVPARSVLDPSKPRSPDRRSSKRHRSRARHEVTRVAARPSGKPGLRPSRRGSLRPLPRSRPSYAARGKERAGVRPAQREETRGEAGAATVARKPHRSRLFGALVRRMAHATLRQDRSRSAGRGNRSYVVAPDRLASSRARRAVGGAGRTMGRSWHLTRAPNVGCTDPRRRAVSWLRVAVRRAPGRWLPPLHLAKRTGAELLLLGRRLRQLSGARVPERVEVQPKHVREVAGRKTEDTAGHM